MQLLDLEHLGRERVIGSYLLAGDEPALVDCGPASCLDTLRAGLAGHGLEVGELRHLLLTHIHLDHAGAAGSLVRENPGLLVHVSEVGAPHLVDPSRLERSARRLYGDDFDRLWGPLLPVPEENVRIVGDRVLDLEVFPTPGPRLAPRLLPDRGRRVLHGRRRRRPHPARQLRGAGRAAAGHRRRGVGADARRDRGAAAGAAPARRISASPTTPSSTSPSSAPPCALWAERARDGSEEEFVAGGGGGRARGGRPGDRRALRAGRALLAVLRGPAPLLGQEGGGGGRLIGYGVT